MQTFQDGPVCHITFCNKEIFRAENLGMIFWWFWSMLLFKDPDLKYQDPLDPRIRNTTINVPGSLIGTGRAIGGAGAGGYIPVV